MYNLQAVESEIWIEFQPGLELFVRDCLFRVETLAQYIIIRRIKPAFSNTQKSKYANMYCIWMVNTPYAYTFFFGGLQRYLPLL